MHARVHAMMTLKCLRMRHVYNSEMQINVCNTFCMVLGAWRCNDTLVTMFRLGDAGVDFIS